MEVDITQAITLLWAKINSIFAHSVLITSIKFFLLVYVSVLFVDIVLILVMRGLSTDLKIALHGTVRPLTSKNAAIRRWEAILSRLHSALPSQYKLAILEADAMAMEILQGIGYAGETMTEQIAAIKGGQIQTKDRLTAAHEVRNRIVHDKEFAPTKEEAKETLSNFRAFFDEVELL